jgi:23S rRNA pseudouridine1911/1915/1917 synthase
MDDSGSQPSVVYEDRSLVAVRKPSRMHSAPGVGAGDLCAWVFERFPDAGRAGEGAGRRPQAEGGLLHRLDYETSGIVLFARNSEAFAALLRQQERGAFSKEYLAYSTPSREALPAGSAPPKAVPSGLERKAWADARESLDGGALAAMASDAAAGGGLGVASYFRAYGPKGSRVACMDPAGRPTGSCYSSDILACSAARPGQVGGPGTSRLEIRVALSRGFRHQVRAHLAWIGLPISGDPIYGGLPDDRLRLYAIGLRFEHPETGRTQYLTIDP